MVQYSTTAGHSTRGDDHAGVAHVIQLDGFVHSANKLRAFINHLALGRVEPVLLVVSGKDLGCLDRHGAVQVDRHLRYPALGHDLLDKVKQHLCPTDGERGHQHDPAPACGFGDNFRQFCLRVCLGVEPVPVSGFAHQHIRPADGLRWPHDHVVLAADIAAEHYGAVTATVMHMHAG